MNRFQGVLLVFIATILWGASGVFIKFFPNIDSISLVWTRNFIGALFFSIFALVQLKTLLGLLQKKKKSPIFLNVVYLLGTIGFFTLAVKTGTVTSAAFLLYVMPLFVTTLYGAFIEKRQVSGWLSVALAFSAVGVLAISLGNFSEKISLSNVWGILAGLSWGLQMLESRKLGQEYPTQIGLAMVFTIATIITIPFVNFHSLIIEPNKFLLISYAVIATVIAPLAFYAGIRYVSPTDGGIISLFDPIFAAIAAYFVLREVPDFGILIGSVFIVIGNMLQIFSPEAKLPEVLNLNALRKGTYVARYSQGNLATQQLQAEQIVGFSTLFLLYKKIKEELGEKKAKELLIATSIERRKSWYNSLSKAELQQGNTNTDRVLSLIMRYWQEVNPTDISKNLKTERKDHQIIIHHTEWSPIPEAAKSVGLKEEEMNEIFGAVPSQWLAEQVIPGTKVKHIVLPTEHQLVIELPKQAHE